MLLTHEIAIPGALNFLYEFAGDYVQASLTADSYLKFIVAYTLGLGTVFQLPLLLVLLHWIKPLTPGGLMKSERWVIVLAFMAAAIITPTPDPLNQTIIALPIIILYQFGVVAVLVNIYRSRRRIQRQRPRVNEPAMPAVSPESVAAVTTTPVHTTTPRRPQQRPVRQSIDGIRRLPMRPKPQSQPERPYSPRVGGFYLDGISRRAQA